MGKHEKFMKERVQREFEGVNDPWAYQIVSDLLHKALEDGYSCQDPVYPIEGEGIIIVLTPMTDEKAAYFRAAMLVMGIDFTRSSGVCFHLKLSSKENKQAIKNLLRTFHL